MGRNQEIDYIYTNKLSPCTFMGGTRRQTTYKSSPGTFFGGTRRQTTYTQTSHPLAPFFGGTSWRRTVHREQNDKGTPVRVIGKQNICQTSDLKELK